MFIIGHKGCNCNSFPFRENTLDCFKHLVGKIRKEGLQNIQMIELDVRETADGILVIYHDQSFISEGKWKYVSNYTYEELMEKMEGGIEKLEDVLDYFVWNVWIEGIGIQLCLDVKSGNIDFYEYLEKLIEGKWKKEKNIIEILKEKVCIGSFNHLLIDRIINKEKEKGKGSNGFRVGYILDGIVGGDRSDDYFSGADFVSVHEDYVEYYSALKKQVSISESFELYLYTVNSIDKLYEYRLKGVDGIITDYPIEFCQMLPKGE